MTKLTHELVIDGERFSVEWRSHNHKAVVLRASDSTTFIVCGIVRDLEQETVGDCLGRYSYLPHAIDCAAKHSGRKPSYECGSHRPKDPNAVPLFLRRKQRNQST